MKALSMWLGDEWMSDEGMEVDEKGKEPIMDEGMEEWRDKDRWMDQVIDEEMEELGDPRIGGWLDTIRWRDGGTGR